VRFGVNADHVGTPRSADSAELAALGIDASHDAHSQWAFPVSVAAAYHF
jgi:hypothetical protein